MEWLNDGNEYVYERLNEQLYGQVLGYVKNKRNEDSNVWIKQIYSNWKKFSFGINAMIWAKLLSFQAK